MLTKRIRVRITAFLLSLMVAVPWSLFFYPSETQWVDAATTTLTNRADFNAGIFNSTESKSKEGEVKLQADGSWTERAWKTPNIALGDQSSIASDGTYVYLRNSGDNEFSRYISSENRWQTLADAPMYSFPGADMVVLGNYIYATFGGYQKEFRKFSIVNNTWSTLSDMPDLVNTGGSLATDGTYIYALRGTNTSDFWRYNTGTDTWSVITSAPATIGAGSSLVYNDGYLYTLRGVNTTTFYRYDISAATWSTMTAITAAVNDDMNVDVNGDYIYVTRGQNTTTFYRYSISGNSWSTLSDLPQASRYVGAVYNSGDGYLYVFRGNSTQDFWKYTIVSDSFTGLTDLPAAPGTGSDLVNHGGYLYYLRGGTTALYRYSQSGGTWSAALAAAPATIADDVKAASAGASLYFMRGSGTTTFYSYTPGSDTWSTLATTPATVGAGGSLSSPVSSRYIYATRGSNTLSFWRYDTLTNTWDDAAVADLPDNSEVNVGARLSTDGTDIYYSAGNGISQLLKYTVGTNTWSTISNLPFAPYYGTDMNYFNGKLYFQVGYYKSDFWEYTISGNSWRKLQDLEPTYATNQGPYNGGALGSNGAGTFYSISGQNISYLQTYSVNSNSYVASGTWTSGTIDLIYVSSFTSLSSSTTTPDDSAITFETRSSADAASWTSWSTVTGGTIASTAQRYIQIRANLAASTDRGDTPVLSALTVTFTGDTTAPTNPSTFTGNSQSVSGAALSSGTTYSYSHPYFTWSGGSDSQTSISGYYVYFGTNAGADPETSGNFQTGSTYTATTSLSNGTYYLRVKTKDAAGNISTAVNGFSYVYSGVSSQTTTATTTADFSTGTVTNTTTASDKIELTSKAGFWLEQRLSLAPATINNGAGWAYASSSNTLFTFRGGNTTTFYSYSIDTDTWTSLAVAPAAVTTGGAIASGPSGYLYALRGNGNTTFWRYDISGNTWSDAAAADAPQAPSTGSSLIYDGSRYLYALRGNSDDTFMRYDTQTDTWDIMANTDFGATTNQITNVVGAGADLAYDGSDTIYATQGTVTGYNTGFSAYSISGNSWSQLENLPATPTSDGGQIEYDSTTNSIYFIPAGGDPFLFKYDISTSTWSQLSDAPATLSTGAAMRNVGGILYILRGGGTQQFYTYNIAKASWQVPTYGLFNGLFRGSDVRTFTTGADIVKGTGNYFYIVRGAADNLFIRYDSSNGEVVQLADAPAGFTTGADLVYDTTNNKIYAVVSSLLREMYQYDVSTDTWTELTSDVPPVDPGAGSSLEYDGSRYIYWVRGANTTAFYRFDTQASAGSRWSSALATIPAAASSGSDMVYDGGYIYATRGNTQLGFYRYDTSANTWNDAAVADLPTGVTIGADGFLVDGGGDYLFACRGINTVTCYQYSISGNSWSAIANAPANITAGGAASSNRSNKIFVITGPGTNTFSNGLYTYVMQTSTSSFQESGTFSSGSHDLTSVYRFSNISLTYTSVINTSLTVATRTSADNSTWSGWATASEEKIVGTDYTYKINSPAARYIQVKFTMTSGDGINTSTVSDYTISYYQDTTAPTNPSSLTAYNGASLSAQLNSSSWYNHTAPVFDWPEAELTGGASDGSTQSGVSGYYVYFGTNASADPQTSGSLQTTTSFTASSLTSGNTYYLRIKTKDDGSNVAASTWSAFTYKFDNVAPTNPTTVIANPPGYSNTNNFDFSWSGATDSASLVSNYCYKTSASGSTDTCITSALVNDLTAYQTGTNTFYVRAKDTAGNIANEYVNASYYYSSTAPSAPQNLEASPTSNTKNEFSFSWDPPATYSGAQSGLLYYYSVNALPTSTNVNSVGLSNAYVTTGSYATQVGANTFYVVAKDEAGNIDYNTYASVAFTADTSAPGIPKNVDIADVSVKADSIWKLALSWETPTSTGSGVANYKVYHSTTAGASCTSDFSVFTSVASTTGKSYVDSDLTQKTHYYCVKACDSTNNCSAVSDTVSLLPDGKWTNAASITADPTVTVKTKSAIVTWSTGRKSNSFVKYGKKSGDYGAEVGSSDQVTSHSISITGLNPGTKYYYKVLWTDEDGNTGSSEELSFTTNAAPGVSNVKVSNVSLYTAYVNFTVKNTSKATIQYGKSVNYGGTESISTSTSETGYTVQLNELTEGTPYHFRIVAEDIEGNTYSGDDYTFETLPVPKITNLKIQQVVGQPTATLRFIWTSNTLISSIVTFYPSDTPATAQDQINLTLAKKHETIIKNLRDDTEYTVIVKGKDSAGNEAVVTPQKVKTATDFRPPEVINLNVESTIVGVGEDARAQIIISWDTDEPSTTQIEYGEGTGAAYSASTQEDTNRTTNHTVTIPGLSAAKIYHLRALAKDKGGNIGSSSDTVIITPSATKDALNLVVEKLSKTFGFIKKFNIKK